MKNIKTLFLFLCFFLPYFVMAQTEKSSNYRFTEIWVWEYENYDGRKGEMAIYRDTSHNAWLLTPDDADFPSTDEMTKYFIVQDDGEVTQVIEDGTTVDENRITHSLNIQKDKSLPYHYRKRKTIKYFGDPQFGFPKIKGQEYRVQYEKTNEKTTFYLGQSDANFSALCHFNELNIDAKLPIQFPKDIPAGYIPLSEQTNFPNDKIVRYEFKYISPTEYFIEWND